jgi:hypothetical protein
MQKREGFQYACNDQLFLAIHIYIIATSLKGSVQRKLRWVENGVNRTVGASDCGAGRSFVILFRFHLGFAIFPFPVSTAQIIGEFWINREAVRAMRCCHS